MTSHHVSRVLVMWLSLAAISSSPVAGAVELQDLKGFDDIFGRYAPAGDCKRQPQILVDASGFTFFVAGKTEKVTNPENALQFYGPDYQGPDLWFFPFRLKDGYSILMTFNHSGRKGVLAIEPQDEGYPGGPALSPRNKALVGGSPYQRCK